MTDPTDVTPATAPHPGKGPIVRAWTDLVGVAAGAVLLVVSALPVDEHSISGAERAVFRFFNAFPAVIYGPVWVVMQLGNIVVVPLATVAAVVARRFRLAAALATAGLLTYVGAKLVKRIVIRGRPSSLVDDVHIHGAAAKGLGFVSGHAAVVVALAVVAFPYLPPRARWVPVVLAGFVCAARVYVGAHLPLDVAGGAGLGLAAGFAVRFVFGRPARCS